MRKVITVATNTLPTNTLSTNRVLLKSIGRRLLKIGGYTLAFVIPPLIVGAIMLMRAQAALTAPAATPYSGPAAEMPVHDPAKPTVVVVASNEGTEITDLLAPYAVFTTADAFNVYVVAPERKFTPFMWGGVDIMPHYSFAEVEQLLGGKPDVIVIPFIKNPEDPAITQWIRDQAGPETLLVSICGGAHVLAATGLADDSMVTTHQSYFKVLAKEYPHLQLVRGVRYTDNGNIITSAGITAGIDASLYTIKKLLGQEVAQSVASRLNYPHAQFLTMPDYQWPPATASLFASDANAALIWQRVQIGVPLFEGVDEIDLTAVLDTYGRTFTANTITFAPGRKAIRSRHGLTLIPRADYASAPQLDRLIIPGEQTAAIAGLTEWAGTQGVEVEALYPAGTTSASRPFAFDVTLADVAQWRSTSDAQSSARTLEYPAEHLQLAQKKWPIQRLAPTLLIGLLSLTGAIWLGNRLGKGRMVQAAA